MDKLSEKALEILENKYFGEVIAGEEENIIAAALNLLWKYETEFSYYEDAEERGLLVRLPCKVGDTVYLTIGGKKKVQKATVDMFHIDRMGLEIKAEYNHFGLVCYCGRLGINVFTTPEEAEAALEKGG